MHHALEFGDSRILLADLGFQFLLPLLHRLHVGRGCLPACEQRESNPHYPDDSSNVHDHNLASARLRREVRSLIDPIRPQQWDLKRS